MSDPAPIEFLFDFISPNAYLAWTRIHALAEKHGRRVEPVPVLFAGLLNALKRPGPGELRPVWRWMARNILRKARLEGIPLAPPPSHPFNPLLALRVASLDMDADVRRRLIDGLFHAAWASGEGITDPDRVARIATGAGLDGRAAVASTSASEIKQRLHRRTESSLERGVFGVPTMLVDGELFWGFDDFVFMDRFLAGDDPLPREVLDDWEAVQPSAWRTGRPPETS